MVQKIWEDIKNGKEVRKNLSSLREIIKEDKERNRCRELVAGSEKILEDLLHQEDAKTRKNTALLIGDLGISGLLQALWSTYEKEETLFVRSSYLAAMQKLDVKVFLLPIKTRLDQIMSQEVEEINQKHIREEIQELNKLILSVEGRKQHKFTGWKKESEMILLANRRHLNLVLNEIKDLPEVSSSSVKMMNAGIRLKTAALDKLMEIRTWQEILFLVNGMKTCDKDPVKAAETIATSKIMEFLKERHQGDTPYYFRLEVKMQSSVTGEKQEKSESRKSSDKKKGEEKNKFVKKLIHTLEDRMSGLLINSPSDYEFEIRLVENKEGRFNVMVKLFTMEDKRFSYRSEVISSSIKPVNAALIIQIAREYLCEGARVLDPFCGVGTMLIERQKKISADTSYGLDIFEEAIEKARRNTQEAGQLIHYINRDCVTFTHEYLFDEILTNMPFVQGKKTSLEIFELYKKFFAVAQSLLKNGGIAVLYTHDKSFVEKLAGQEGFVISEKSQMNVKEDTWVYILRKK